MDSMELKKQQRLSISDYRIDKPLEFHTNSHIFDGEIPDEHMICSFIDKFYLCWDDEVECQDTYRIEYFENGVKVVYRYDEEDETSSITTVILLQEDSGNYYAIILDDECDNPCEMWIIIKR